jgi:hypothetical protein
MRLLSIINLLSSFKSLGSSVFCSDTLKPLMHMLSIHCKNRLAEISSEFPARESLVSDIPAGDGKTASANLFLQCMCEFLMRMLNGS